MLKPNYQGEHVDSNCQTPSSQNRTHWLLKTVVFCKLDLVMAICDEKIKQKTYTYLKITNGILPCMKQNCFFMRYWSYFWYKCMHTQCTEKKKKDKNYASRWWHSKLVNLPCSLSGSTCVHKHFSV